MDQDNNPHPARVVWLPPHRLRRYQWAKVVGGLLIGGIFAGWLIIQWSSLIMRLLTIALIAVTGWVVAASVATDRQRARGRQLWIEAGDLCVEEEGTFHRVPLSAIASAEWRDDAEHEDLTLYDKEHRPLLELDPVWLADEAEGRTFLAWLRENGRINFPVKWQEYQARS